MAQDEDSMWRIVVQFMVRDADKSLARLGRKQSSPVKRVMGRGMA